jgi:adenylyltransferase/sulfurtransferase
VQATEALKLVLGIGSPLIGRLLTFDALGLAWRELKLAKDPDCPMCGTGVLEDEPVGIEATELAGRLGEVVLLDCREPHEWEISGLEGALRMPMGALRLDELPRDREIVVICSRGPRARFTAARLMAAGFARVAYLEGGLFAWATEVDPTMRRY